MYIIFRITKYYLIIVQLKVTIFFQFYISRQFSQKKEKPYRFIWKIYREPFSFRFYMKKSILTFLRRQSFL